MTKNIIVAIALVTSGLIASSGFAKGNDELLKSYDAISMALAKDDLAAAKSAASELAEKAKENDDETISKQAGELANSASIDAAREGLKRLSDEAANLAKGSDDYHVMTCPMAKANWVQSGDKVMNPYMGKKMQQCGGKVKDA
jgi:hypothetical protein